MGGREDGGKNKYQIWFIYFIEMNERKWGTGDWKKKLIIMLFVAIVFPFLFFFFFLFRKFVLS